MSSIEELKVLAVANFVQKNFKADLLRKADVVQLLLMAARAVRNNENHEVPESWIKPELVELYSQSTPKEPSHGAVKEPLRRIK